MERKRETNEVRRVRKRVRKRDKEGWEEERETYQHIIFNSHITLAIFQHSCMDESWYTNKNFIQIRIRKGVGIKREEYLRIQIW